MKQYRPQKRGSQKGRFNKNALMAICGIIAAVIIVIIVVNAVASAPKAASPTSVFASNVTINGVSVSGMTSAEAKAALKTKINDLLAKAAVQIKVPTINKDAGTDSNDSGSNSKASASPSKSATQSKAKTSSKPSASPSSSASPTDEPDTYTVTAQSNVVQYSADQLGISLDADTAIKQAMDYSLSGKAPKKSGEEAPVMDFTMLYTIDQSILSAQLQKDASSWTKPAQDASYILKTAKDNDQLTTSATPVKQDAVAGSQVDITALIKSVSDMVAAQSFKLIQAPVTAIQPKTTSDNLKGYTVIGTYQTSYSSAPSNRAERMYNIWKMSSILNGTIIQPGQTISINDIAGPRTVEGGWQLAPGIENGQYSDQPGGGICQVSTTIYNAAIRAELKTPEHIHHTYPSAYVPHGLDATISTDEPDLKIQNNTDYPVLIGINCNVPKRTVQVSVYGVETRDYKVDFTSQD
ncbi:MAG: VanW family protein, partial [Eubacteriales bacterium]